MKLSRRSATENAHIHLHETTGDKHFDSPSALSFALPPSVDERLVIIGCRPAPKLPVEGR